MEALAAAAREVVRFCVGSPGYQRGVAARVVDAVSAAPLATVVALLDRAHLGGAFEVAARDLGLTTPAVGAVLAALAPDLEVRRLCQHHLRAELEHLDAVLAERGDDVHPIALKGISYWGALYPDPIARRVRDLDLLVDGGDGDAVCDALEAIGYAPLAFVDDERSPRQHLAAPTVHSAPPYRIRRRVAIDVGDPARIRTTVERAPRYGLDFPDALEPVYEIDVELHAALFTDLRGALIRPDPDWQRPIRGLRACQQLRVGAALAYTASKLELDALGALTDGAGELKPWKLVADFVRLLVAASQADLDLAVLVARRWDTLHDLIAAIDATRALAPETRVAIPPGDGRGVLEATLELGVATLLTAATPPTVEAPC